MTISRLDRSLLSAVWILFVSGVLLGLNPAWGEEEPTTSDKFKSAYCELRRSLENKGWDEIQARTFKIPGEDYSAIKSAIVNPATPTRTETLLKGSAPLETRVIVFGPTSVGNEMFVAVVLEYYPPNVWISYEVVGTLEGSGDFTFRIPPWLQQEIVENRRGQGFDSDSYFRGAANELDRVIDLPDERLDREIVGWIVIDRHAQEAWEFAREKQWSIIHRFTLETNLFPKLISKSNSERRRTLKEYRSRIEERNLEGFIEEIDEAH